MCTISGSHSPWPRSPWPRSPWPYARVGLTRVPFPWRPPTRHTRLPSSRSSIAAACRACYDSACQLTLQSLEGLDRGGNKTIVYHPQRAVAERPTRDLELPAEDSSRIGALSPLFDAREIEYLAAQAPRMKERTLADLWHGDGNNPDAVLTVLRHYDNAFVVRGAVGGMPKTAWVDYPIFERMYYDLVAGFDVYRNVAHQIATRIYMNLLRIEGEGQLLGFLQRASIHERWCRGRIAQASPRYMPSRTGPEPSIVYTDSAHAKEELLTRVLTKELPAAVAGPREPIQWQDVPISTDPARARFEVAMRALVQKPAPYVAVFPDTVLLRVRTAGKGDLVYTIARNRAHLSVEWARRSDPRFWSTFDFFTDAFSALDAFGAAVLDLSRYTND